MSSMPGAGFVMIGTEFVFCSLEPCFNSPARPIDVHRFLHGGTCYCGLTCFHSVHMGLVPAIWLGSLPVGSVSSWKPAVARVIGNFTGL